MKDAQPLNEILSVLGFMVRGNCFVDDIELLPALPKGWDSDEDGLDDADEMTKYHTLPYFADSDGDGYGDGAEIQAATNPMNAASHP